MCLPTCSSFSSLFWLFGGSLRFHMKFRMDFYVFTKKVAEFLIGNCHAYFSMWALVSAFLGLFWKCLMFLLGLHCFYITLGIADVFGISIDQSKNKACLSIYSSPPLCLWECLSFIHIRFAHYSLLLIDRENLVCIFPYSVMKNPNEFFG